MSDGLFTAPLRSIDGPTLARLLPRHRWPVSVELDFQNAVAEWLERERFNHRREHDLGEPGTIDFYFPDTRVGLELKVKGGAAAVLRQLQRYARCGEIDALVLLTGRASLAADIACTGRLSGKPLHVAATWAGGL